MSKILIISLLLLLFGCNTEDSSYEEINGNEKIITKRRKGKIGETKIYCKKIKVLKLRIDDDSEYHITFINLVTNQIESDNDVGSNYLILTNSINGISWRTYSSSGVQYQISYPANNIEYFED